MTLNLVLLLFVMVLPFPTATLAAYLRSRDHDAHIAAAAYGLAVEGVALSFLAITTWTRRRGLLHEVVTADAGSAATRRYGSGAIAIAIGLSFISAVLALAVHMRIAIYFLAGQGPFSRLASEPG